MERHKKNYQSKWQNQYTEEFKRHVCNDFLTGSECRRAVERKYKLGNSRLDYWLKELGYEYSKPSVIPSYMHKPPEPDAADHAGIKKLRQELEEARLLAHGYHRMIDVAEQEFKIHIRKKSNTK